MRLLSECLRLILSASLPWDFSHQYAPVWDIRSHYEVTQLCALFEGAWGKFLYQVRFRVLPARPWMGIFMDLWSGPGVSHRLTTHPGSLPSAGVSRAHPSSTLSRLGST